MLIYFNNFQYTIKISNHNGHQKFKDNKIRSIEYESNIIYNKYNALNNNRYAINKLEGSLRIKSVILYLYHQKYSKYHLYGNFELLNQKQKKTS